MYRYMHGILQFNISFQDGAYTADGLNVAIVTFGRTAEELWRNISEAAALYLAADEQRPLPVIS